MSLEPINGVAAGDERLLMRLLHGELRGPEAQRLRERMKSEMALASRHAELESQWRMLEGALAVSEEMPDIASKVSRRLRSARPSTPNWFRGNWFRGNWFRGSWFRGRGFGASWFSGSFLGQAVAAATLLAGVGLGWWAQLAWESRALDQRTGHLAVLGESVGEDVAPSRPQEQPRSDDSVGLPAASPTQERPAVRIASADLGSLDEDLDTWSKRLDDIEWVGEAWEDPLGDSASPGAVAQPGGSEDRKTEVLKTEDSMAGGWDPGIADGWGLQDSDSLAMAYLGLADDLGAGGVSSSD